MSSYVPHSDSSLTDLDARGIRLIPDVVVLLVNLEPDEIREVTELLSQFDLEIRSAVCQTIEGTEPSFSEKDLLLVILRIDERRRRPDQDIRRIRRMLKGPVPLLLLITPEHAGKVKEYLRAGADEYWILPLDSAAFPPRLQILLEWGQAVMSGEAASAQREQDSDRSTGTHFLHRAWHSLRRLLAPGRERSAGSPGTAPLIASKWEKIRRLGFGSFAEVWLVRAVGKEDIGVAKIPHSPKLNTKCIREAAILRRLTGHPNAVQLKEVVKEEGKVILIQEYAEGATLEELLGQAMDSVTKERAFLQLMEVVAYAHKQNIMHRDIKPENIIVTSSGMLKLLDFGTGKDLTRRSISNTIIGSRPFMAPEQIMGKSRLSSDVWALGVILYALATGFLPFYDDNEKQLMDMILESSPERPIHLEPDLPEELEYIILRCLQKDWNERYRDAVELREEILDRFPQFGQGELLP